MENLKLKLDKAMKDFDKNKVKVIAIDIDETLINNDSICTEYTTDVIKQLIKTGRQVYIVTGRVVGTAIKYANQLGIPKYMINGNGAMVWNMQTSKVELEIPINQEITINLIKLCREREVFASLYVIDRYFYEYSDNPYFEQYQNRITIQGYKQDLLTIDTSQIQKFFIMGPEDVILQLYQDVNKQFGEKASVLATTPRLHNLANPDFPARCLEIMGGNVSKGNTLKQLVESQNMSMEDVVSFGDDINDIDMLQYSGWGVAMNNARPSVKAVARLETLSNNDDGVGYFIEKYLL